MGDIGHASYMSDMGDMVFVHAYINCNIQRESREYAYLVPPFSGQAEAEEGDRGEYN